MYQFSIPSVKQELIKVAESTSLPTPIFVTRIDSFIGTKIHRKLSISLHLIVYVFSRFLMNATTNALLYFQLSKLSRPTSTLRQHKILRLDDARDYSDTIEKHLYIFNKWFEV